MNILLTGGTGYIGSHTAVVLAQAGHNVILFDNLSNSNENVLDRIAQIIDHRLPFVRGDVRDTELLREVLRSHKIDAVIHFAGLKSVAESVERSVEYYSNNVQGTISLIQAMQEVTCRKLVFSSSATVYGEPVYLPFDENHPTHAVNPYGRGKLYVEGMLADLAGSDRSWKVICLRYFNPVGAHESGLIGEKPNGIPNNLMPYIAQVATGDRDTLNVFGDDYPTRDGTGIRDYIHVLDLADGHAAALGYLDNHAGWHAFNLGAGKGYSVLEMVKAFEIATGKNIPIRMAPRRPGDIPEFFANVTKAQLLMKWQAKRTVAEMCSSSWKFQSTTNNF
jgi:UDP-glucose 4-epimerase